MKQWCFLSLFAFEKTISGYVFYLNTNWRGLRDKVQLNLDFDSFCFISIANRFGISVNRLVVLMLRLSSENVLSKTLKFEWNFNVLILCILI